MSAVARRGPLPPRLSLLAEAMVARGGVVLLAVAAAAVPDRAAGQPAGAQPGGTGRASFAGLANFVV